MHQGRKLTLLAVVALAAPAVAQTTTVGATNVEPLPVGARNFVSALHAEPVAGGTDLLLAGPRLVYSRDGLTFSYGADTVEDSVALDPPIGPEARAYSLDAEGDTIWVGLGFLDRDVTDSQGNPTPSAAGFAVSTDAGETFTYRFPQLDEDDDLLLRYGVSVLLALPIIELAQSPPYGLSLDERSGEIWVAGGRSGLRQSFDGGRTFRRVVLPPDTLDAINPTEQQSFPYVPQNERLTAVIEGDTVQVLSLFAANFFTYAVLADEAGTVWVGSAAGLNRSDSTDVYAFVTPGGEVFTDRAWRRFTSDGTTGAPGGDVVYVLRAQPQGDATLPPGTPGNPRDPVWFAHAPACADRISADCLEESGLTVWTGDGPLGPVFEPRLLGVRVNDVAFAGDSVYAAAFDGLYAAPDGRSWSAVRTFRDVAGAPLPLDPAAQLLSAAVTDAGTPEAVLWVGTSDGLLRRPLAGAGAARPLAEGWTLYRAAVPARTDSPTAQVPDVDAYAYPNPYVVGRGFLRFRFELDAPDDVVVRVFDFAMEPVRTLEADGQAGPNEVLWDGRAESGARVASGVYVYVVQAGGETFSGRLVVVN
jgi:hypothetical protein